MTNTQFEALMRELRALRAALSPLGFAPAAPSMELLDHGDAGPVEVRAPQPRRGKARR